LGKVAALPVKKVFPAHHSLDMKPEILIRMREAFRNLKADGKLSVCQVTLGQNRLWQLMKKNLVAV
jgi:hypothetical protein